jgi:hypothetical protein
MSSKVSMTLLITTILFVVVKVVTTKNDSVLHLVAAHNTTEDPSTDADITGEGTLLVNVFTLDRLTRRLEAQANVLPITTKFALLCDVLLCTNKDSWLFLESFLSL